MPHIHNEKGYFDFAVEVFIVYKDKVLLRKHDKYDIWLGVGGHIELNEDPNQASIREVKEEVGLDIKLFDKDGLAPNEGSDTELVAPAHLNRHAINDDHNHVALIYYATTDSDNVVPENINDEWLWMTKEEVDSNKIGMSLNIKYYALEALRYLS
jgi:8-oxo-dGTP pyrophosphatase MutT (NUDIX family)